MTREDIIDLLTFARVYDGRVTIGKAETAAWFLAVSRVPFGIAQQAIVEHYSAPVEPGAEYPRISPGHVMAYFRARNRPDSVPVPAIEAPKASREHVARCKALVAEMITTAAARYQLADADPDVVPRWRPGMDKQDLARRQVEATRRRRALGGVS